MKFKTLSFLCAALAVFSSFAEELPAKLSAFYTEKFKYTQLHLQGIDCDESGIYFGFANGVTKTDWQGKVLAEAVSSYGNAGHIGDLCVHSGKVYATSWIQSKGTRKGLIQVFDAKTLKPLTEENKPLPYATDGIAFYKGNFWIGKPYTGPQPHDVMTIAVWDENFSKEISQPLHRTDGTKINYSMQTLAVMGDLLWHGCYIDYNWYKNQKIPAAKNCTYLTDDEGKIVCASPVWAATGIALVPKSISGEKTLLITGRTGGKNGSAWIRFWEYKDNALIPYPPKTKGKKP